MSLVSALYTGVTGIQTNSAQLQSIGNNIANVNTVGFKSSQLHFADLVSVSGGSLDAQIGRGARVEGQQTNFSQGSFQTTNRSLDLSVDGSGFFVTRDIDGRDQQYTRTGTFGIDQDGNVVAGDGEYVQGFTFDQIGNLSLNLGSINLNNQISPPNATGDGIEPGTGATVYANLDAKSEYTGGPFDINSPISSSNFFTSARVYDSQGNDHVVTLYFTREDPAVNPNSWTWNGVVDGADSASGATEIQASGTLGFTAEGALDTESAINYALPSGGFDFKGGVTQGQVIGFDFGDSITTDMGTGFGGTSQFSSPSIVNFTTQDGFSAGSLRGISIDEQGTVTGVFSNGRTRNVARLALATFQNENGLLKIDGNRWVDSPDSGEATISQAGQGSAGSVLSQTLELSNVDLAGEFVNLISSQRALQASARMLSTSDEMLSELVNLTR